MKGDSNPPSLLSDRATIEKSKTKEGSRVQLFFERLESFRGILYVEGKCPGEGVVSTAVSIRNLRYPGKGPAVADDMMGEEPPKDAVGPGDDPLKCRDARDMGPPFSPRGGSSDSA